MRGVDLSLVESRYHRTTGFAQGAYLRGGIRRCGSDRFTHPGVLGAGTLCQTGAGLASPLKSWTLLTVGVATA